MARWLVLAGVLVVLIPVVLSVFSPGKAVPAMPLVLLGAALCVAGLIHQ